MIRRRGLVRGISALVVGSALGVSAATATAAPPEPTPFHATGRTAGAGTTLTARVDPSLPETIGLPAGVGSIRPGPGDRYPSVDPGAFGPVSASVGIEGSRVAGGCAVAEGSIDAEVRRALSPAREAFDGVEAWDGFECGAVPEPGYAIGVADSTLAVGYGQDDAAAVDHAASGARRAAGNAEADRVAPAALSGDAVAYATLGDGTRSRLRSRADSSVDGLDLLLGAVEAVGVAVEVGRAKSRLQYGAVVDPSSLSAGEASKLARAVAGDGRLDVDAVSRHGRLLVVESTVATDAFWRAHGASIEALSE
jgi:hypothetical protein